MLRSRSPSPWLRAGLSGALLISAAWGLSGCREGSLATPTRAATHAAAVTRRDALRLPSGVRFETRTVYSSPRWQIASAVPVSPCRSAQRRA